VETNKLLKTTANINVIQFFLKIKKRVIFNRLLKFFESKNILCKNQYGFRKNYSTYTSLIDMYNNISLAVEENKFSIGVLWIYQRRLILLILLSKLEFYGIRGWLWNGSKYIFLGGKL